MIASKVSSKSQVTLPREVRKHRKLKQGDVIVYTAADEAVVMRKASRTSPPLRPRWVNDRVPTMNRHSVTCN